ncbi:MAG TPA: HEPN domain-containing protein [Puia sp.]|nr:HEPN domain-containing protein [Puia sp.]
MGVALQQFKESVELASALKKLEREKYPAEPSLAQQPYVKGLRGGAAVLMVAAFEFFIRKLFEENISRLNTIPVSINFNKLPNELKVKAAFHGLKRAMDGPLFEEKLPKVDRINDIVQASKLLINDHINPETFSETGGNPNSATVKEKFKDIGISDIFSVIKVSFEAKWGQVVPGDFIKDKLDQIVRTRHVVAHTADTLNISRSVQNESLKFLNIIAELLEKEMEKQVLHLKTIAKR